MNPIEYLRQQIENVSSLVSSYEGSASTSTLAGDLSAASFRQHLQDLRSQLTTELGIRSKEIVEVALSDNGEPGTIPLHLLAGIALHLGEAVEKAARYKKRGTAGGPVPRDITETTNLRLAALSAAASTHLYITGNTAPDLFGYSLVEDGIRETFAVLEAQSADLLVEAVSAVGYSAASSIKKLLRGVSKEELTIEIIWRTPEEREMRWRAEPDAMRRLADSLDAFSKAETTMLRLGGKIITISLRDPFVIETDQGEIYSASVASDVMQKLQVATVGSRANVQLLRDTIRNRTTGREKITYKLVDFTPR